MNGRDGVSLEVQGLLDQVPRSPWLWAQFLKKELFWSLAWPGAVVSPKTARRETRTMTVEYFPLVAGFLSRDRAREEAPSVYCPSPFSAVG